MSFSLIPKEEIEKSKLNEQIVKETAQQVIKDFALFGMEINFPENIHMAYDELFYQLTIFIEELMKRDPEKLSSLLYQIDLDEKKMKNAELELFHEHEWISDMILEREFMKVLTRNFFRSQHP
jgi:hypothetical protein